MTYFYFFGSQVVALRDALQNNKQELIRLKAERMKVGNILQIYYG